MYNSSIKTISDIQHSYLVRMVLISHTINKSVTNTSILTSMLFIFLMVLSSSPQCVFPFLQYDASFLQISSSSSFANQASCPFSQFSLAVSHPVQLDYFYLSITTLLGGDWYTGISSILSSLASCVL